MSFMTDCKASGMQVQLFVQPLRCTALKRNKLDLLLNKHDQNEHDKEKSVLTGENHITLRIQIIRARFTTRMMIRRRTNR